VTLPLTEAAEREEPTPVRNITGYEGPQRKVLVADDKEYNRQLLVALLEPLGFEVSTVEDGQQAVDRALELQPDAIVMDLVMPVKTGFEAAREIRGRAAIKNVFIIAASASVLEADREKSLIAGCDAFLPKPIKAEQLLDLLAKRLELRWTYDESEGEAEALAGPLVPPPSQELAMLHQLVKKGQIIDIQKYALDIETMGEAYAPFARKLQALANRFEIEQIKTLVEQFIEEE
jgi:CheY-like chemotaxis protein